MIVVADRPAHCDQADPITFLPLHHHLDAASGSDLLCPRLCIKPPTADLFPLSEDELLL